MEDIIYWIWLSILDLRPIEKIKLIEIFGSPEKIFKLSEKELRKITNKEKLINILKAPKKIEEAIDILKKSINQNIEIINILNKKYPSRLKQIYGYPIILYAKGNVKLLESEKTMAIVGSRDCTEYGRFVTKRFSHLLCKKNFTIISGMAEGIDSIAHQETLTSNGKTIAVLGSGINFIYPKNNEKLYYDILKNNGLIISEYPLNTRPTPNYFPMRNRIISGLADKILITEASKNSGSIITANLGLEQGKDIYAIPGNITSLKSAGTNELIKEGAILVSSLEDIINL